MQSRFCFNSRRGTALVFLLLALFTTTFPRVASAQSPPALSQSPQSHSAVVGSSTTFSVTASGQSPLSYRWYFNGSQLFNGGRIAGASSSSLQISGVVGADAGDYWVTVSNQHGIATSDVATLTVLLSPDIEVQPTNQTVILGDTARFMVTAAGAAPLTYQWQLNGTNVPDNLITTVAGNGVGGYSGDGAAAGKARLMSPLSVALDSSNNLFIADTFNHRIRKVDNAGIITTVVGDGTNRFSGDDSAATNASLNTPVDICFDASGNLFIADGDNHRIRRVGLDGIISTFVGNGTNGFSGDGGAATNASLNSPAGICFDVSGNLFIGDTQNHRVRRVGIDGIIATVAGNGTWGAYAGDGSPATNATLSFPRSVALDASGNLLIAEAGGNRVRKVAVNGIITTAAGTGFDSFSGDGGQATNAGLSAPSLALGTAGDLFVVDEYNNRIRKVNPNGIISTVAGTGAWTFSGDNVAATNAALNFPLGVAQDDFGNLFIADRGNHRIREVEVTTYPTLTLKGVTPNIAGNYRVIVSNPYGSSTSSVATLTVLLPPAIATQPDNEYVPLGDEATFTVVASGDAPLDYRWFHAGTSLSDDSRLSGTTTANLSIQNVQAADSGGYVVVVSNAWGSVTSSVATLNIATIRYVDAANTTPAAPYTSWVTAATVIQHAIDAGVTGDWVIVTNGVYQTGGRSVYDKKWNRVVMTNQTTVVSVNGPRVTTILGDLPPNHRTYGTRGVWLGAGAKLSGFTISGGGNYLGNYNNGPYDTRGGGILCESRNAVITDCVITGNSGCWYGGGVNSGTLINCVVNGNSAWQFTTGGQGGGAYNSTLINCTVVGNSAAIGGGTGWCLVSNSVVYFNSSNPFPQTNSLNSLFAYSCTTPDPGGIGNLTGEPAFVDLAGGDLHLQTNSPCLNAGNNTLIASATDLEGSPRVVDGIVDMGAYERQRAPWIVIPAASQSGVVFSNVTFNALALGDEPLAYQWQKNGVNLSDDGRVTGSATPALTISNLNVQDMAGYRVVVTNGHGSVTSAVALLTVLGPPIISSQPASRTVPAGTNVGFSVTASGLAELSYQWRFNQVDLIGKTNTSFSLTNVQSANAGDYDVVITNTYGAVTSAVATLTVVPTAPTITTQAVSRVVSVGQNVSFSVAAKGTEPMICRWQFEGTDLPGANGFSLSLTNVNASFAGAYRAAVSNAAGLTFSSNATLVVSSVVVWPTNNQQFSGNVTIPASVTNVVAIAAGKVTDYGNPCFAVRADGVLISWGGFTSIPANTTNVVAISAHGVSVRGENNLALIGDGTVVHWSSGFAKQPVPAAITNGNLMAVAAGGSHQLVLRDNGNVFAWGSGGPLQTNVPPSATNVIAIAAGIDLSLALRADGTVVVWGPKAGDHATAFSNVLNVAAISAGGNQALGLFGSGSAFGYVVTNDGPQTLFYGPPPANATNLTAISAGRNHSLALRTDGTVLGWGNTNLGRTTIPAIATNVVAIAAGSQHSLALVRDPFAQPIPPRITRPPLSRSVAAGHGFVLNSMTVGGLPLNFQWLHDGAPVAGQTNQWLFFQNAQLSDAGDYQLVAANGYGSVTSSVAIVSVSIPQPVLQSIEIGGNGFSFSFQSVTGVLYISERRDALVLGPWTEVERRFGSGGLEMVTDVSAGGATRFYRVRTE